MIDVKKLREDAAWKAEDGATLALFSPATVLELLDRLEAAEREVAKLRKRLDYEGISHSNTVDQRDHAEEMADKLSAAIMGITGRDIGEHSSANCPWSNALEHAEEYSYERDKEPAQ